MQILLNAPPWVWPLLGVFIFCDRFLVGATTALNPERAASQAFVAAVCAGLGIGSGAFLARTLHILRTPTSMGQTT